MILLLLVGSVFVAPPAQAKYASLVMDAETGEVLYSRHANTRRHPASLVKMMTLYMVFDALEKGKLKMNQGVRVSRRAAGMPPSRLGLRRGQTIRVKEAILALVTKSANDAAVVLAEAVGRTESRFARIMTDRGRKLGMTKTTFRNASGLPNRRQLSTARDMAILARALLRDFPQYYHFFSTQKFKFRGRTYRNHNKLLRTFKGADGIKTGYIRAAGYNLVASGKRNGRRVIAVVFGGKTSARRNRHTANLLEKGFKKQQMLARAYPSPPPRKPAAIAARDVGGTQTAAAAPVAVPTPPAAAKVAVQSAPTVTVPAAPAANGVANPTQVARPAQVKPETAGQAGAVSTATAAAIAGASTPPAARFDPSNIDITLPSLEKVERVPLESPTPSVAAVAPAVPQSARPPAAKPPVPKTKQTAALSSGAPKANIVPDSEKLEPRRKPGRYGVQVGAFYRYRPAKQAAQRAAKKLPQLLADTQLSVTHIRGARGKIYRSRLLGLTKRDARQACRKLKSLKIDCMVVRAGRSLRVALDPATSNLAAR